MFLDIEHNIEKIKLSLEQRFRHQTRISDVLVEGHNGGQKFNHFFFYFFS